MKSVLISIRPRWCELIANGRKTAEVRKNRPTLETPFKCYIYCTMGNPHDPHQRLELHTEDGKIHLMNGTVIGEFVCEGIETIECSSEDHDYWSNASCLSRDDFIRYCNGKELYGWRISDLKIYDKPKRISEFDGLRKTKFGLEPVSIKRPPQSWCYVEGISS